MLINNNSYQRCCVKARSNCSDNENDNDHGERVLLVELLHAEYAHAHSTNRMRPLGVVIVIVIAAMGPGFKATDTETDMPTLCNSSLSNQKVHVKNLFQLKHLITLIFVFCVYYFFLFNESLLFLFLLHKFRCNSTLGLGVLNVFKVLLTGQQFTWGPLLNFSTVVKCSNVWQDFARELRQYKKKFLSHEVHFVKFYSLFSLARDPC